MKISPESPYSETQAIGAASTSKQAPNLATPTQAESLLAAEKHTLEKMANGASLSEVLNDLCAATDAHGSPVTSNGLFDERRVPCAGPHVPATFKAAITPSTKPGFQAGTQLVASH